MSSVAHTNWAAFAVVALGTLVGPLDSAVNVAFPSITAFFGRPDTAIQWVIVSYVISYATLLLIFGRIGDLFGHLAVFRCGLLVSAIAFLVSSFAQSFEALLLSRGLQGFGTAMVLSCGPALATAVFSDAQRSRALGGYTAILGVGMAIGPTFGGVLVGIWGWQAVFGFRVPIAVAALVMTFAVQLPQQRKAEERFDAYGALAFALLLCVGLVAISRLRHGVFAAEEAVVYAVLAGAAVLTLASVGRRDRSETSLWHALFRNPDLMLVTIFGVAVNCAGFALMLLLPFFLSRVAEVPVELSGFVLAASPVGMVLGGYLAPRLTPRFGTKPIALAGALFVVVTTWWMGTWQHGTWLVVMFAAACLHGLGLGLFQAAQLDISTRVLPRQHRGVAGSLVMLTRTLGVVMAASALTALFVFLQSSGSAVGSDSTYLPAFRTTFLVTAGSLVALIALSLIRPALWLSRDRA